MQPEHSKPDEQNHQNQPVQNHGTHHRVEPTGEVTSAPPQAVVYTAPELQPSSAPEPLPLPTPAANQWQATELSLPATAWSAPESDYSLASNPASQAPSTLVPQAVVQVLSPRGVEYVFLTIALFTAAFGLASALLSVVNGQFGYATLSFPVSLLLVGLPIFASLFLHLKKSELRNPSLALDPSKRRSTQVTQVISFVICLFSLVGLVVALFSKMGGQLNTSVGKILLDVGVIVLVFGAILFYYWRDEHQNELSQ